MSVARVIAGGGKNVVVAALAAHVRAGCTHSLHMRTARGQQKTSEHQRVARAARGGACNGALKFVTLARENYATWRTFGHVCKLAGPHNGTAYEI